MGEDAPRPKYLVVNADEMEPGTFKDRLLLEGNPHQLIEGTHHRRLRHRGRRRLHLPALGLQAGRAAPARRPSPRPTTRGYLGKNILGSGFNLEMHLHISAGRYMCGEETGLLNALEGKRAIPRAKPPYPADAAACGASPPSSTTSRPSATCPHIVSNGAEWFKGLSRTDDGGTKLYGVSGRVKQPGPVGAAHGHDRCARSSRSTPAACATGYALPRPAARRRLDRLPDRRSTSTCRWTSTRVQKAGSRLGTGTMIVLDDRPARSAWCCNLERFFARESCGWCTPCREGLPWMASTLEAIEDGRRPRRRTWTCWRATCQASGRRATPSARWPRARSSRCRARCKYFRDDFERHISEKTLSLEVGRWPTIYIDSQPYEFEGEHRTCSTSACRWASTCPTSAGTRPCTRSAPAASAPSSSSRTRTTRKGRIVMACMTPAADGTRISIDDPEARAFRARVIEWLMANHPHDCPVCDEGGECHLQDMTVMTGHDYRRYRFPKRTHRNQDLGPFVNHEMNRCIQCYRCVRFYRDYAGGRDLDVFGWHDHVYFGRHEDGALESEFSGNLVEVCPTGVFTDKTLQAPLHPQVGPADGPVGLRPLRPGLQHDPRRALRHAAAHPQPLQPRGERLLPVRPRPVRLRVRQQPSAASASRCVRDGTGALRAGRRGRGARSARPACSARAGGVDRHRLARARRWRPTSPCARWSARRTSTAACRPASGALLDADARHPARRARRARRRCARSSRADAVLVLGEDVHNTAPMLGAGAAPGGARSSRMADRPRACSMPRLGGRRRARGHPAGARAALRRHAGRDAAGRRGHRRLPRRAGRPGPAGLRRRPRASTTSARPSTDLRRGRARAGPAHRRRASPRPSGRWSSPARAAAATAVHPRRRQRRLGAARTGRPRAWLCFTVPECNSLGVALLGGGALEDAAARRCADGEADTVVVAGKRPLPPPRRATQVAGAAATPAKHVDRARPPGQRHDRRGPSVVLPAATFAEADGTLVNNEGRAQRFFQVFVPAGRRAARAGAGSATLTRRGGRASDGRGRRSTTCSRRWPTSCPRFAGVARRRAAGRLPHRRARRSRASRTATAGAPPCTPTSTSTSRSRREDPDSPLAFSMEGYHGAAAAGADPALLGARAGTRSRRVNKFQDEVGGAAARRRRRAGA